ncbi:MAG: amylo-alpha-1,6-glucosidase [Actinomycetota bacterium]|nr:amylo-alpha-1,6-glucosidase [Actinomycetota bacterium]
MTGSGSATGPTPRPRNQQPYLFNLVSCVNAPSVVVSAADGQIDDGGVQGWLYADQRLLSRLHITVNGFDPVGLSSDFAGAAGAVFRSVVPQLGDPVNDPTVFVERHREVGHRELRETVTVTSAARQRSDILLVVEAAADFSTMAAVRTGKPLTPGLAHADGDGLSWPSPGDSLTLHGAGPPDLVDAGRGTMSWRRELAPGDAVTVTLRARAHSAKRAQFIGADTVPWSRARLSCVDQRVPELLVRGLDDLEGLLLREDAGQGDLFVAAGAPWFLTLFGRDSLWTARMLLPVGTDLAMSTLRVLARRQGARHDSRTEEQPGRILHEVRPEPLVLEHFTLPPTYYGTADATQLFVIVCAEAWRWGADTAEVESLLPAVESCLAWMKEQVGNGFLRYVDATGGGLSNQGWKDSADSVQWATGSLAEPPIALSEVQAYAFQAAMLGADLLDGFGRPGGSSWRAWAASLGERFRAAFWVADADGAFPAVALDAHGAAVDSVASNMGHLLATGLLSNDEEILVARRLASPEMNSGFGLRTLSARSPRFSRTSYHGGAVWPHDTAIAVGGLARAGFGHEAESLFLGMVRAASSFDFRLPELYGGDSSEDAGSPLPYPAACRPQAWSAAAPIAALVALLGLEVDVPRGRMTVRPQLTRSMLPLSLSGLCVGGHHLTVTVDEEGRATIGTDHAALEIVT